MNQCSAAKVNAVVFLGLTVLLAADVLTVAGPPPLGGVLLAAAWIGVIQYHAWRLIAKPPLDDLALVLPVMAMARSPP